MSLEHYEDIKLRQKYRSREYHLTEQEIIDFAKAWDPQPFHIDPEAAKKTRFGGLFASGLHLIAISTKLANEKVPKTAFVAGLGTNKLQVLTPGRPGDLLILEVAAVSKRQSKSDANTGIVHFVHRLLNQRNETVLAFKAAGLVEKRHKV